jgi:predicted dehydrogenase
MPETGRPAKLRCGVVGVGHLGALHAQKYVALEGADLAGVYDVDRSRSIAVAERCGCRAPASLDELLAEVDAVSIAVPSTHHADVAVRAARAGVHLLVEKPLAHDLDAGRRIERAANEAGVTVQVGHLERFNPVFDDLRRVVRTPRFIECHRLSPYAGRGADIDVVFDVMIHDIDLLVYLVGRAVVDVQAVGVPVLSDKVDIANARLRFEGGCIANVTASRVSLKRERKLRIFQEDAYVSVDFDARSALVAAKTDEAVSASPMSGIAVHTRDFADADPLAAQIASFVACVRGGEPPVVGLGDAMRALELAALIVDNMEVHAGRAEPAPGTGDGDG